MYFSYSFGCSSCPAFRSYSSTNWTLIHNHIHTHSCTHVRDTNLHTRPLIYTHAPRRTFSGLLKTPPTATHSQKVATQQNKHCKNRRQLVKNVKKKAENKTIKRRKSGMKMNRARKTEFAHAKGFHTSLWPNQSNLCASPTFQVCCIWEELCGCPTLDGACGHSQCKDNARAKEILGGMEKWKKPAQIGKTNLCKGKTQKLEQNNKEKNLWKSKTKLND